MGPHTRKRKMLNSIKYIMKCSRSIPSHVSIFTAWIIFIFCSFLSQAHSRTEHIKSKAYRTEKSAFISLALYRLWLCCWVHWKRQMDDKNNDNNELLNVSSYCGKLIAIKAVVNQDYYTDKYKIQNSKTKRKKLKTIYLLILTMSFSLLFMLIWRK